ncbi:MAG: OmpH family outer membrane protein [Burkholderia sp.]|nr:OmpH family outer membrane protein [Burkholderia sp.]
MLTGTFSKFRILSVVLMLSTIPVAYAEQDTIRIVSVNSARILQESASMQIVEKKIKDEFAKRAKDLQDISQKLKSMSSSLERNGTSLLEKSTWKKKQNNYDKLKEDFQIKQSKFYEDLNQRRNEELSNLLDKIYKVIKKLAEQQNYDLVIQEAVYASPHIDITDKVLKELSSIPNN